MPTDWSEFTAVDEPKTNNIDWSEFSAYEEPVKRNALGESKADLVSKMNTARAEGALGRFGTDAITALQNTAEIAANPIGAFTRATAPIFNKLAGQEVASEFKGIPTEGMLDAPAQFVEEAARLPQGTLRTMPGQDSPLAGGVQSLEETLGGLSKPETAVQLPVFGATGPLAQGGRALVTAEILRHMPETVRQANEVLADPNASMAEKGKSLAGAITQYGMAGATGANIVPDVVGKPIPDFTGKSLDIAEGAPAPIPESTNIERTTPEQRQAISRMMSKSFEPTLAEKLGPTVPETPPELEKSLTVLQEIREKGARTKEDIRKLFPQLSREQAGQLRDQAWPEDFEERRIIATIPKPKEKGTENAIPIRSAETPAVDETPSNSQEVGARVPGPEEPANAQEPAKANPPPQQVEAAGQVPLTAEELAAENAALNEGAPDELSPELKRGEIDPLTGARFDGETNGRKMFTAMTADGKESTSFVVKSDATPEQIKSKYNEVRDRFKDDPNQPKPLPEMYQGVPLRSEAEIDAETDQLVPPESPATKIKQVPEPTSFNSVEDVLKFRDTRLKEERDLYKEQIGLTDEQAERLQRLLNSDRETTKFEKDLTPEQLNKFNAFFDGPFNQRNGPWKSIETDPRLNPQEISEDTDPHTLSAALVSAVERGIEPNVNSDRFISAVIAARRLKELGHTKSDLAKYIDDYATRNSGSQGDKYEFFKSIGGKVNEFLKSQGIDLPEGELGKKQEPSKPQELAPPKSDYDRYQELVKSIKGKSLDEAQAIAKELEQIKNRNGGMPPKAPESAPIADTRLSPSDKSKTKEEKVFRSTAEGQKAMASRASRIATLSMMNEAIRKIDQNEAFSREMISSLPDSQIDAWQEDLRQTWNKLKKPKEAPPEPPIEERGAAGGNIGMAAIFDPANYKPQIEFANQLFGKAKDFASWSVQMLKQFGETVRDHLKSIWNHIRGKTDPASIADEMGLTFKSQDAPAVNFTGMPPEMVAQFNAQFKPQWEFTDRRKGSRTEGITFYAPEGSTPQQIRELWRNKVKDVTGSAGLNMRVGENAAQGGFLGVDLSKLSKKFNDGKKELAAFTKEAAKETFGGKKMTDYRKSILNWSAKLQRSFGESMEVQKDLLSKVPDLEKRQGIVNWIQSDGDPTVLASRLASTSDPKLAKGYRAALTLTPEEIRVARDVQKQYSDLAAKANYYDILKTFKDNYVTQLWDIKKGPSGQGASRTLRERFKFSKASSFPTYFDGEQAGFVPKGNKDIAQILPVYMHEMNKVIADRQLVEEMAKGTASDGRPLLAPRGSGTAVDNNGKQATLVMPKTIKGDTADYKVIPNQPALNDWRWATNDSDGNPVLLKSDLAVHPEALGRLKAVLGRSAIREWYDTKTSAVAEIPKAIVKGLDNFQSTTKRTMLGLLAPFHQVQEGTHAIGHRVNPLFNIPKVDLVRDPGQMDAAKHGLMMLPDRASEGQFMEGLRPSGLVSRIPLIGKLADYYSNYLFHEYIPGLKYKTYTAILDRNNSVYAKDLAAGKVTPQDIKVLSAEQTNAAYGHLNYADLGRNPTVQHMMQLGLLAPDFLEARARFTGQGIKGLVGGKAGREQIIALATLAVAQAALAYTTAKLTGGEWDKSDPFSFKKDNRRYTMRSVPEDLIELTKNTRQFVHSRISPIVGKGTLQYLSGVNYRGQKVGAGETTKELLQQPIPISARGFLGIGNSPLSGWEQLMGAVGLKISRDTSRMDVGKLVNDWMSKSTNPKIQQAYKLKQSTTFPDSIYKPLKSALEANDNKKALEEAYALIDNEPDEKAKKKREALILKEFNPFSYPNKDKDQKDPQVEIKPFATHSKEMEQQFRASLDKAGKDAYRQAIQDQVDLYVKLYRALYGRPEYPEGTPEAYQR